MSEKKIDSLVTWLALTLMGLGFIPLYFLFDWVEGIDKDYRGLVRGSLAMVGFFWPFSYILFAGWIKGQVDKIAD